MEVTKLWKNEIKRKATNRFRGQYTQRVKASEYSSIL